MSYLLAVLAWVCVAGLSPVPHRATDQVPASESGYVIRGRVLDERKPPVPVRRALITLRGSGLTLPRTTVSDDDGRFRFGALPEGVFRLLASRAGFVSVEYGAQAPRRIGRAIRLGTGRELSEVELLLLRGGVVTGTVRDTRGRPLPDILVNALTRNTEDAWELNPVGSRTDEHGDYRLWGLAPGDYLVQVRPATMPSGDAYEMVKRPGSVGAVIDTTHAQAFVPIFYPGVPGLAEAQPVAVVSGEVSAGVDVLLKPVAGLSVAGRATTNTGAPAAGAKVTLSAQGVLANWTASATAAADGSFRFQGVSPGRYVVRVRHGRVDDLESAQVAESDVVVVGDITTLELSLKAGVRLSGSFERAPAGAASVVALDRFRVSLLKFGSSKSQDPQETQTARVAVDGRFEIAGVLPGQYSVTIAPKDLGEWRVGSIYLGDQNVLDRGFTIRSDGERPLMIVKLTNQHAELDGRLQTDDSASASDFTLVVIPEDKGLWSPVAGRVRAVRLDESSSFRVERLPGGRYFVAVYSGGAGDDWKSLLFLEKLTIGATLVELAEGEKRSIVLTSKR